MTNEIYHLPISLSLSKGDRKVFYCLLRENDFAIMEKSAKKNSVLIFLCVLRFFAAGLTSIRTH